MRLSPDISLALPQDAPPAEWTVAADLVPYPEALAAMDGRVAEITDSLAGERVWLVQHPPLYTAGTSAKPEDGLDAKLPVFKTGRGGQWTYHGPGQRIAYPMLDLKRRRPDVRAYVGALEAWLIDTLAAFGVKGETREDRVGVWVVRPDKPEGPNGEPAEDKIAAIGVRVRRWVTMHGVALNVSPNLSHFRGITPCGVRAPHLGVTSFDDLGRTTSMAEVDAALREAFVRRFGAVL